MSILEDLRWKKFPIPSDGYVTLVDWMGDDASIVQAARVSYGAGTKKVSDDRGLIRYLMRHRHTTPFEMCEIKFLVRVQMDAWRQWIRHRTASVNEYSTRYSEAIDSCNKTLPGEWRSQATDNKQGSGVFLPLEVGTDLSAAEEAHLRESRRIYEERLKAGVAREQARKDLPLSTYTEAYWKIDLHNLFHFLSLRMDKHAQLEIRQFADQIAEIVKVWVPLAWEAFEDYRLNGMVLTGPEITIIQSILDNTHDNGLWLTELTSDDSVSKREIDEINSKMKRLGVLR